MLAREPTLLADVVNRSWQQPPKFGVTALQTVLQGPKLHRPADDHPRSKVHVPAGRCSFRPMTELPWCTIGENALKIF